MDELLVEEEGATEPVETGSPKNRFLNVVAVVKQWLVDLYTANVTDGTEGTAEGRSKIDTSNAGLHRDAIRRRERAMGALTDKPVSSTRGGPKWEKRTVVTSESYKPELDRF